MERGKIKNENQAFVSLTRFFGNEKMQLAVRMFVIRLNFG